MKVDFYLSKATSVSELYFFVAELLIQGLQQNRRYVVYCANESSAHQLDEMLWTAKPEAFIPHQLASESDPFAPVVLSFHNPLPQRQPCILVNLNAELPTTYQKFTQIIDISVNTEDALTAARLRYKFYKQLRYPLTYTDCRKSEPVND